MEVDGSLYTSEYTQSFRSCKYISKAFLDASISYDIEKINYLLKEYGNVIDINYQDELNRTPLIIACQKNNYRLVECIIYNFKEDIDILHRDCNGDDALLISYIWANIDIIKLIEREYEGTKFDIYFKNVNGECIGDYI